MNQHVIQLSIGNIAIIVDNDEFIKVKRQFKKMFSLNRILEIKDVRGRIFVIKRKQILLLEEYENKE